MKKAVAPIPIHDFAPENDLGAAGLRYVPLEVNNSYDFSEAHRHAYFEMFFFRKGGGVHLIDFIAQPVADCSIHIVRPGQVHLLQREPDSHGAVIHFSTEVPVHLGKAPANLLRMHSGVLAFEAASFETFSTLLTLLQQELAALSVSEDILWAYLDLLVVKIARHTTGSIQSAEEGQHFSIFRSLVEQHYREGRQPSWYAAQLFLTEKRLNETCKAATGNTVGYYLKERVLLEAKRLLSYSKGSVKEIGYHLGFDDPAYFTRFFRKNVGMTAIEFRDKYR